MSQPTFFMPPAAAASLFFGNVMHARLRPVGHRFNYSVFNLLINLDRTAEAGVRSRLFSVDGFNLLSFHSGDHGEGKTAKASLREQISELLKQANCDCDSIHLWCYPRVLGFVFNPISVYFCYLGDQLTALVYEVRNTFGEMHTYVAPVRPGEISEAGVRQERAKQLYVSPFMDMELTYKFRIRPPAETLAVRILETDAQGPLLAATFVGERRALNSGNVLRAFFGIPLMTTKVVIGIHWEALRLWMKGMRLRVRPKPPPCTSQISGLSRETTI